MSAHKLCVSSGHIISNVNNHFVEGRAGDILEHIILAYISIKLGSSTFG